MQVPEDQLLARCRAGDVDGFGELYATYGRLVYRYAYHMLGNAEDAMDIRQETFVRAFQGIGSFRNHASLQTWLMRICANLCRDRARSAARRREVPYDPQLVEATNGHDRSADPSNVVERADTIDTILRALSRMSPADREVILLRDVENVSTDEAALILGCTARHLNVKLFRARSRLRERVMRLLEVRK